MLCNSQTGRATAYRVDNVETEIVREKKKKLHSVDEKKHDRIIQSFLDDATLKLNQCEKKLKGM